MVEWKKLGEVCKVHTGSQLNKSDMLEDGPFPVVNGGKDYSGYTDKYNENAYTITISQGGESAGFVNWIGVKFWAGAHCYVVEIPEGYDIRYLFHTLKNKERDIQLSKQGAGIPGLNRDTLYKQVIPIPSLEEQTRIVGILDTFTASIDNLKEQIAQRRKQYEYYRDQLLDLEGKEGVEKRVLKEVCEVINGRAYSQPELLDKGKYRVLRVGNFFSNDSWYYSDLELENKYYCQKGDLLYAWSASFGPHIWEEEKTIYHYHIWKMVCSGCLDKKFMFYWLQSEDMKSQAFSNLHGATMAHLTKALMESLMVPILPLPEQQRIASILDTFEASIQNLEAQLKQREKQYEYYRNRLLTFE
jgi:type I restriction enzyme S subunit